MDDRQLQVALAEYSALQDFVAHQEDLRSKLRSVTTALVTGLTLARASDEISVEGVSFLVIALGVVSFGWVAEASFNSTEHTAIRRSRVVESALRGDDEYDGPQLGLALQEAGKELWVKRVWGSIWFARLVVNHLGLATIVVATELLA